MTIKNETIIFDKMSSNNHFSQSIVPDYIKQDYSYDSESNNRDETMGTAINTSLTTARGVRITPNMILNASNSAVVGDNGVVTQSGPIVFQINIPLAFMYSNRSDKRIVVRAVWFWSTDDSYTLNKSKRAVSVVPITYTDATSTSKVKYAIRELSLITSNTNPTITYTNPVPIAYSTPTTTEPIWQYTFDRYLLQANDTDNPTTLASFSTNPYKLLSTLYPSSNLNLSAASDGQYQSSILQDVSLNITTPNNLFENDNNKYGWSAWSFITAEEITTTNNNRTYLTTTSSNGNMKLITCPVISTLTSMTNSRGITSMMSNTPYDHPTEFISSSLPYFLVAFSKDNGELYTIPAGVSVNDYCRVFVELTCLY